MKRTLRRDSDLSLAKAMAVAAGLIFIAFFAIFIINNVKNTTISTPKELEYAQVFQYFSGKDNPTRTLILFANNAEQRFGGGFIGSYAILNGKNGSLHMSDVNNIYNIDFDAVNARLGLPVPEYMKFLAPYLSLRDSGLSHSWPDNARSAMRFYEADTGKSVDNVIELTPNVLRALLKDTGPVTLKDYNLTITDENFLQTVQLEVEAGEDKKQGKDPKAGILTGLAQVLMQRMAAQDLNSLRHYSSLFEELTKEKHILVYSSNSDIQRRLEALGLTGTIKKTDYNYFQIAEANFGADKSSPFIEQKINYEQNIDSDGTSNVLVSISRRHTKDFSFPYVNPYTNKSDWLVKTNNAKIDVLIPKYSKLESINGVNKYERTSTEDTEIVSYISDLAPLGGAQTVVMNYAIPQLYDVSKTISVNTLIQKQNGGWPYSLTYTLHIPAGYHLVAANSSDISVIDAATVQVRATINSDTVLSFIYEKD